MTKPSNKESIETATHKSWEAWVTLLNEAGAQELDHAAIAGLVHEELDTKIASPGWWAQSVTVAYEQHIGRRRPGQRGDGMYETSVTKQIAGTKDGVFTLWREAYDLANDFNGLPVTNIRTSITPVRHYWRADGADGSRITVAVETRGPGKAMISITHGKLPDERLKDGWQAFWKRVLEKL